MVFGIGIAPATEFLAGSGIALDHGYIAVDELLRTSAPNVYAAGDVTCFFDPVFAGRRHIEHWDNAIKQGRLAAFNMMGRRLRYDEVSYFYCDLGDLSFAMLGAPEEADEWIERGSLDKRSYALFYLKNNVLRGLFSCGRPAAETRTAEGLIRYRVNLSGIKERLRDPAFALEQIPEQTALILQGGGALGAFECGAVKALEEEQIFPDIVAGVSIGCIQWCDRCWKPTSRDASAGGVLGRARVVTPNVPLLAPFMWGEKSRRGDEHTGLWRAEVFQTPVAAALYDLTSSPANWISFYDPTPIKA